MDQAVSPLFLGWSDLSQGTTISSDICCALASPDGLTEVALPSTCQGFVPLFLCWWTDCVAELVPSWSSRWLSLRLGLPWWLSTKVSTCQGRRYGFNPWVRKIPWRRKWWPTPVLLPGESHGQRRLEGYRPRGHRIGHDRVTKNNHQALDRIAQWGQRPSVHGQTSPLRAVVSAPPSTWLMFLRHESTPPGGLRAGSWGCWAGFPWEGFAGGRTTQGPVSRQGILGLPSTHSQKEPQLKARGPHSSPLKRRGQSHLPTAGCVLSPLPGPMVNFYGNSFTDLTPWEPGWWVRSHCWPGGHRSRKLQPAPAEQMCVLNGKRTIYNLWGVCVCVCVCVCV